MFPRPLTVDDLAALAEIDGTIQSSRYLHLNRALAGAGVTWTLEERELREPKIDSNRLSDDLSFDIRQVISGIEDGLSLGIDLNGAPAAALIAQPRPEMGTMRLLDLRVDYDFRRQGLGTALACAAIGHAREHGVRAVTAETSTDNFPAIKFLKKLEFEPAGLDTHRHSNHDLVKERATLLWCLALD